MPLTLQDAKADQATHDMMELRPLGAGLTAGEGELILAHTDHCLDLRAKTIQSTELRRRQREATCEGHRQKAKVKKSIVRQKDGVG